MTFNPQQERKLLERKIRDLKAKEFVPEPLLHILAEVYKTQITARADADVALRAEEELADAPKRAQGAPLIERANLPLDTDQATTLFKGFLDLLKEQPEPVKKAAGIVAKALDNDEIDPLDVFRRYMNDDAAFFHEWAKKTPDSPSTLYFLAKAAVTPSLARSAELLYHEHIYNRADDKHPTWEHGYCPVCGSLPLIGQLQDKEGVRMLTCSFCLIRYRVMRIICPFCGEKDFDRLDLFDAKEEPGYKVETCQTCKMYLKCADFRELDRASLALLDDLESLSLDVLAQQEGYTRPTLSGWGF